MELIKIKTKETVIEPVSEILKSLSTIKISDGRNLFSFRNNKVTNSLKNFEKYCIAIYDGTFLDKYKIDKNKSVYNIAKNSYVIINECKGDWNKIYDLIVSTAFKYKKWFDPENEPLSKKWLPRDVARWMYDEYNRNSLFMVCISYKLSSRNDEIVNRIIQNLPDGVYKRASKIETEIFNSCNNKEINNFWFNVNQTYKIEKEFVKKFRNEYMVMLWLEFGKEGKWTEKYLKWLPTCWGENTKQMLKPWHVGPRGKTWPYWIHSNSDLKDYWDSMLEITKSYYN